LLAGQIGLQTVSVSLIKGLLLTAGDFVMDEQHCQGCAHQNSCEKIYDQLCNSKGPSVLRNVVEVFLLPLVLFVVSLVLAEHFLAPRVAGELLRIFLMVFSALIVVAVYILVLRIWRYKN